jgi:hypothetical protein
MEGVSEDPKSEEALQPSVPAGQPRRRTLEAHQVVVETTTHADYSAGSLVSAVERRPVVRKNTYRSSTKDGKDKAIIALDMLNPDVGRDGHISAKEAEIYEMIKSADLDGDGKISIHEFYALLDQAVNHRRAHRFFKRGFIASLFSNLFLVVTLTGMMAAMIVAFKDLYAEGSTLSDGHGSIIGTREATASAALYLTPVRARLHVRANDTRACFTRKC